MGFGREITTVCRSLSRRSCSMAGPLAASRLSGCHRRSPLRSASENPEYKYSLAFVGYGNNPEHAEIELTYNHGVESYDLGSAYGHIALGVPDAYAACATIKESGGNVTREAGPVKGGSTVIAFVTDPDGYKIELIQRADHAAGGALR